MSALRRRSAFQGCPERGVPYSQEECLLPIWALRFIPLSVARTATMAFSNTHFTVFLCRSSGHAHRGFMGCARNTRSGCMDTVV